MRVVTASAERGVTLVGVLVGITIGLIVLAGALTFFDALVRSEGDVVRAARLNAMMRETLDVIHRDLRRAGYWSQAARQALPDAVLTPSASRGAEVDLSASTAVFTDPSASVGYLVGGAGGVARITRWQSPTLVTAAVLVPFDSTSPIPGRQWVFRLNPFQAAGEALAVAADGTCVTYAYDTNFDAIVDPQERFGFRLNSGTVEMLVDGGRQGDCEAGDWEAVSDKDIVVTALQFSDAASTRTGLGGGLSLLTRTLAVTLSARLAADADVHATLDDVVRLRNSAFSL